ncbi:hypothetical protein AOZ06_40195 [Kibdelosporangium phytohabitans]|uniref:Non-canonical purine NTP pyrophosphatase n=2 Tax=Kibdelosporangium phytohabitans TaxID=860235 RepID=A0A0N9IAW1_9PSEU|nr:hypothetical protein AOZ06_40195 [Kibdelosporangium phytohabitans]
MLERPLESVKLNLPETQEVDVVAVAKAKAEAAYAQLREPVLVDDTGLTVHEWGKLPGAFIAWFLDNVGNEGIIKMLSGWDGRDASVTTAIGFCDGTTTKVFEGTVKGTISEAVRGGNGFGYDPIFIPIGSNKTFAEMTDDEKDKVSMRRLALEQVKSWLVENA